MLKSHKRAEGKVKLFDILTNLFGILDIFGVNEDYYI